MNDIKNRLPLRGEVKVMEVIVARNRRTIGKEEWQQDLIEIFTLDGDQIGTEQRVLSCQGQSDVIREAIGIINSLQHNDDDEPITDTTDIIEKLNALIIY